MHPCKAEDVIRKGIPCEPSEGMYDGKPQNYCKHCGRKNVKIRATYFPFFCDEQPT